MELRYSILDPTGNMTALVESAVEPAKRQAAAAKIMGLHPEVEQVGFLSRKGTDGLPVLTMAGGEFCGNASMCAAGLLALRGEEKEEIRLRVSGVAEPVAVRLQRTEADAFKAELKMPPAMEIVEREIAFGNTQASMPLVRMEGISHLIMEESSPFFTLLRDRHAAERAVIKFCTELSADGLGLLFLEGAGSACRMTPLVYVPGSGTLFWENSCASGSAAVGMYLAQRSGTPARVSLYEPGGILRVTSEPNSGETHLQGSVRLKGHYTDG